MKFQAVEWASRLCFASLVSTREPWLGLNHPNDANQKGMPRGLSAGITSSQVPAYKGSGGEGGIRTPDTLSGMPVFKTGAINHSATSPRLLQFYYSLNFTAGTTRDRDGCAIWTLMLPLDSRRWMGFGHLHRPDRGRAHVHGGAEIAVDLVSFGRAEPISLGLVDDVVHAPGGAVALVFESVGQLRAATLKVVPAPTSCTCSLLFKLRRGIATWPGGVMGAEARAAGAIAKLPRPDRHVLCLVRYASLSADVS